MSTLEAAIERIGARYGDPTAIIPLAAMAIIIFCVSVKVLGSLPQFRDRGSRVLVGLCVTLLSIYGFDRAIVAFIIDKYVAMGVCVLVGIALLIGRRSRMSAP